MSNPKLDDQMRRRLEGNLEPLRPATHPAAAQQRARIVDSMRHARQEIAQIFIDSEYWNTHVRQPHEPLLDPDPNGDLRLLCDFYDRALKHDTQ